MGKAAIVEKSTGVNPAGKHTAALTLLERTVCLSLSCNLLGNQRKVELSGLRLSDAKSKQELATDTQELRLSKQLLDNELLQPIRYLVFSAKQYLRGISVSGHRVFGPGVYMVPVLMVAKADQQLEAFKQEIDAKVEELVTHYRKAVQDRKAVLGPLWNEQDYFQTDDEVRREFGFEWNYVSFATPEKLEHVSKAMAATAQQKYLSRMSDAFDEYKVGLRRMALEVTEELAKRLAPGPEGKAKALRGTALDDLTDLFAKLPLMDVADDAALTKTMAALRQASKGVDVAQLKDDQLVRQKMVAAVTRAKDSLASLVEVHAGRGFAFGGMKK